jgi:hypothetical protein
VIHYTSNNRILLFSRFLTGELDSQDFNFYITMIQHFDDAKGTGLGLFRSLSDDYLWVPLPKLAAINKLFHNASADSVYPYIDSLKQTSISNATRYIVDFDSMSAILLKVYQDERRMLNSVLVDVFNAVDIDRTGMMRLEEFGLLCAISNIE